ncbi:MAG: hypothetical protein HC767_01695 [Akkermansiaceae bacterium]|nr:hypothetical protein [Akkermansiaceae bacterium]
MLDEFYNTSLPKNLQNFNKSPSGIHQAFTMSGHKDACMKTNSLIIKFVSNVISPLLALAAFSTQSSAAIAYAYTGPTAGNQNFTGALGLDFDVLSSIQSRR